MGHRDLRPVLSSPDEDLAVLGAEEGVLRLGGAGGSLYQGIAEEGVALRAVGMPFLSGALVVAGTDACPGAEVACTLELGHVGSDDGDDADGIDLPDSGVRYHRF